MEWKIEIRNKKDIKDLGIVGVKKVSAAQVFIISGEGVRHD